MYKLKFKDDPNYAQMRHLLGKILLEKSIVPNCIYDWNAHERHALFNQVPKFPDDEIEHDLGDDVEATSEDLVTKITNKTLKIASRPIFARTNSDVLKAKELHKNMVEEERKSPPRLEKKPSDISAGDFSQYSPRSCSAISK